MTRCVVSLVLIAFLGGAQAVAGPLIELRPVDAGGERSAPYAVGEPIDLEAVSDSDGLLGPETGQITFDRTGYYRQVVQSSATTDRGAGHTPSKSVVVWITAGQVATIRAQSIPISPFVIYHTDRTRFSFEFLGAGIPPPDPGAKTVLSALVGKGELR